ncbi:TolB-like translocation protein [Micromonospora carbonacea]|uniref:hypothetical protein n=1 Tax=Micromonospora carbonacea TaxID=47853 RepID=UPI0037123ADA
MRSRLLTAFVVLAVAAVVPPASAQPRPSTAHGPSHEPIEVVATIPFPGGVVPQDPKTGGTNFSADLAPDGRHIVTTFAPTEGEKQVGVMDLDGTDFHCITCGRMKSAWGPDVFPDQQRMLVQVPSPVDRLTEALPDGLNPLSAGTGDQSYAVVECLPSVYDCRTLRRQPLEFPRNSLLEGAQNRTVSVSPDGRYVKWAEIRTLQGSVMVIGRLHSDDAKYTVRNPLVLNPPYRLDSDVAAWSDGSRYYETGAFADGGRTLKYGTEGTALNYDIYELDLATGRRTRVTTDLDYNELYAASPDGASLAYSSGRGLDRMTVFSQVTRPPLIDLMSFSQLGRIALWNNRLCMNEMWLMPRGTQSGTYGGQPVVPEDNWHIRGWSWFADGTKALVTEFRDPAEATPVDPVERVRLQILSFPNRKPTVPEPVVDLDTVDMAGWAIPYDRYVGMGAHAVTDRTIEGSAAGTARVRYLGTFAAGSWTVDYEHYSEDGVTFLDGSETAPHRHRHRGHGRHRADPGDGRQPRAGRRGVPPGRRRHRRGRRGHRDDGRRRHRVVRRAGPVGRRAAGPGRRGRLPPGRRAGDRRVSPVGPADGRAGPTASGRAVALPVAPPGGGGVDRRRCCRNACGVLEWITSPQHGGNRAGKR